MIREGKSIVRLTKQQFKFLTSFNKMTSNEKEIYSIPHFFIRKENIKGLIFEVFTIEQLLKNELNEARDNVK